MTDLLPSARAPRWICAAALAGTIALAAKAQEFDVAVTIPEGVPLRAMASDFSASDFEARGGLLVIHLSGTVRLENVGQETIRALALRIEAGDRVFGGRAAVTLPSQHTPRGDGLTIPINVRLLRPLPLTSGPAVVIEPDSVLFTSMTSAGPDRLGAAGRLRVLEAEARRDRAFFLAKLESGGLPELATAMQDSLHRQAARPRLSVRLAGNGPTTAGPAADPRRVQVAFLDIPGAPVIADGAAATGFETVWSAPEFDLRNRGDQAVQHLDIGWLAEDAAGVVYSLGSAPLGGRHRMAAGTRLETRPESRFRIEFPPAGGARGLGGMTAFLRSAGLEDGSVWVPSREALEQSGLADSLPVSAEEERLSHMYRHRGARAVEAELRKLAGVQEKGGR